MNYELYKPLAIHELGQRANQEDTIYPKLGNATTEDRLFLVCDGMGGHEKGEVASGLVCQSFQQWFAEHIPLGEPLSDDQFREALDYVFSQLDAADDGAAKKMGTTLTFLYLHRDGCTMAYIGDSRIYHIRPFSSPTGGGREGAILYQSRDHSLVFELFQAGEITYDEMRTSPQKNIITRAMQPGEDNRVRADIVHTTDIRPGDYFYLCTDGMLEEMENDELVSILSADISDEEKRHRLIEATTDNKDNHSAYLIHIKDVIREEGDEAKPNDEATSRYNAINLMNAASAEENTETPIPKVEEVEDDETDVSVVEELPVKPEPPYGKSPIWKRWLRRLAGLLLLIAVAALGFFARGLFGKEKAEVEELDTATVAIDDSLQQKPQLIKEVVEEQTEDATQNTKPDSISPKEDLQESKAEGAKDDKKGNIEAKIKDFANKGNGK